ncbi:hypothetical protein [Rhodopseudomonas parapalustris]
MSIKRGLLAVLSATALGFIVVTSAGGEPLGGDVEKLASRFNAAAKSNKLSVRIALSGCQKSVRTVCRYKVTPKLLAMADSGDGSTLENIAFIYGGGDTKSALTFFETILVIMATYAPGAEPSERGVIFRALMEGLDDGKPSEAELHGITFKLMKTDGMGLWLLIKGRDS